MENLTTELQTQYSIKNIQLERLAHEHNLRPTYKVTTNTNKFLLKQYDWFDNHRKKGLHIVAELHEAKYPCTKVLKTSAGTYNFTFDNKTYALFEYLNGIEKLKSSKPNNWPYLLGAALGKLHGFKPKTEFDSVYERFSDFADTFNDRRHLYKHQMPTELANKIINILPKLDFSKTCPKLLVHNEFTLEHVIFKNDKVFKIIDWDEMNLEYSLYDLGVTLTEAYPNGIYDKRTYDEIIEGYESERVLTKDERDNLEEAVIWGHFKFLVWSMKRDGSGNLNETSLKILDYMLK